MTREEFTMEIVRLRSRFGDKPFDTEFVKLVAQACSKLPHSSFARIVTEFIGSRQPNQPPLLQDFHASVRRFAANDFARDVNGALGVLNSTRVPSDEPPSLAKSVDESLKDNPEMLAKLAALCRKSQKAGIEPQGT